MKNTNRRKFIKSLTTGIAGSIVLPALTVANDKQLDEKNWKYLIDDDTEAFWEAVKKQFAFAPQLRYFNNASLGPSPIPVQKAAEAYRKTFDSFPSKYMWGGWKQKIETVRENVAQLFSVSKEEIALIHNTTEGMNLIARSFDLKPGDEVILADHEHPSGTIPWEFWQESRGMEIVDIYRKAITSKTKIISMCHIVNTNGMILPVREVSKMAHEKGILVGVDGAQSAGMFKIDLHYLECDFYAASTHKWLFSPKGVGVFYAKKESQQYLKPLMVARGHTDSSIRRLENYNTRNLSEILGFGAAVEFYDEVGQQKIHQRSYELKSYFRSKIENNPKFKIKTPSNDDLSCAIQVVEVVGKNVSGVKKQLADKFNIDCRPMSGFNLNALRFSFAIYITKKDIDDLVRVLVDLS